MKECIVIQRNALKPVWILTSRGLQGDGSRLDRTGSWEVQQKQTDPGKSKSLCQPKEIPLADYRKATVELKRMLLELVDFDISDPKTIEGITSGTFQH